MLKGTYLTLQVNGSVIAETVDVSVKAKAKKIKTTTKDSGINSSFMGGKVKIAIAGKFLLATSGANWNTLYDYQKDGTSLGVSLYRDNVKVLEGNGIIKRLSVSGADSGSLVTGSFGVKAIDDMSVSGVSITTEGGVVLTTESGETLITE